MMDWLIAFNYVAIYKRVCIFSSKFDHLTNLNFCAMSMKSCFYYFYLFFEAASIFPLRAGQLQSAGEIRLSSRRVKGKNDDKGRRPEGFFPSLSFFLNKKGLLNIWSKIYGLVCMCDVRVKKLLAFFGEINSKCLVGVEGVTGNGGSSKNVCVQCMCMCVFQQRKRYLFLRHTS